MISSFKNLFYRLIKSNSRTEARGNVRSFCSDRSYPVFSRWYGADGC